MVTDDTSDESFNRVTEEQIASPVYSKELKERLNRLLRGEMSAVETYEQVIHSCESEPECGVLRELYHEHQEAVRELREYMEKAGVNASEDSGMWGAFVKLVTTGAKMFGKKPAIWALREGEEHGLHEYQEAVNDPATQPEIRDRILREWIPAQNAHIELLSGLNETDNPQARP